MHADTIAFCLLYPPPPPPCKLNCYRDTRRTRTFSIAPTQAISWRNHFFLLFLILLVGCASTVPAPEQIVAVSQDSQASPCWRSELCRSNNWPESEWYLGFAEDTLKHGANAAEARKILGQQARGRMVESIRMDVSSQTEIKSESRSSNAFNRESINKIFAETIKISAGAEVINTFTDSYYDYSKKKNYAFAAVKKSDLAAYYAQMIELNLSEAMHGIALSKQLSELGKRNEAFIKLSEAKEQVESTVNHRILLLTVDTKKGLERSQSERTNELLKEIAMVRAELTTVTVQAEMLAAKDDVVVFIAGSDIIASGLQAIFYDNEIRITEKQKEASYTLKIDANLCNLRAGNNFHYANACVKVILTNAKTNINEVIANITGPKEGGLTAENAGEKAFMAAIPVVWAKVKDKIPGDL